MIGDQLTVVGQGGEKVFGSPFGLLRYIALWNKATVTGSPKASSTRSGPNPNPKAASIPAANRPAVPVEEQRRGEGEQKAQAIDAQQGSVARQGLGGTWE